VLSRFLPGSHHNSALRIKPPPPGALPRRQHVTRSGDGGIGEWGGRAKKTFWSPADGVGGFLGLVLKGEVVEWFPEAFTL
jgi:hypothetical protein